MPRSGSECSHSGEPLGHRQTERECRIKPHSSKFSNAAFDTENQWDSRQQEDWEESSGGYPQELGGDGRWGLEQRLRVVAAEQLDLSIPAGVAERVRNSGEKWVGEDGMEFASCGLPGGDGEYVEEGVVGEEGGVGGDAVVEGQPRAHVLGAQAADGADVLLQTVSISTLV
jgi:hypothetical protein